MSFQISSGVNLHIDSSDVTIRNKNQSKKQRASNFSYNYRPPLKLNENSRYIVGIDRITIKHFWHNISSFRKNNILEYRKIGETEWKTVIFPDGNYNYYSINAILQYETGRVDPNDKNSKHIFKLYFHEPTSRIVILIDEGYEINLNRGELNKLLGFDKKILNKLINFADNPSNLLNDDDEIHVHCDLILNQNTSDVIFKIPTVYLLVENYFRIDPQNIEWHPLIISKNEIDKVDIRVTDRLNRELDLDEVVLNIVIKKEG